MLDPLLRRWTDPLLNRAGAWLARRDLSANAVSLAGLAVGLALARPDNALWAALLLASFVCTASSFLGRAVLAAQRGEPDDGARGAKSFFHAAGIVEGTETIFAFVLFCLFPTAFPWLAGVFALLCFGTAAVRVFNSKR